MGMIEYSFAGEVVVVTGAARGIGSAVAKQFVESGARVAMVDLDGWELERFANELGESVLPLKCDVTDNDQLVTTLDEVRVRFGKINVLVNCAGMSARVPAEEYSLADYDRLMSLNVRALFAA